MLLRILQAPLKNIKNISQIINIESCLIVPSKKYSRWSSRRASRIINEDELFDIEENTTPAPVEKEKQSKSRSKRQETSYNEKENEGFETLNKAPQKPKKLHNTKLYENEKMMASLMMSVKSKTRRKKNNLIVLESTRLIQDAINAGSIPKKIIFSRLEDIECFKLSKTDTEFFKVPYRVIQLWSKLKTSPGMIAFFEKPQPKELSSALPISIICDNIRDPGNMGSIIRAAAGVGCEKIILTKGCVDIWEDKVIRSAAGAHFKVPVFESQNWENITELISDNAEVYLADNRVTYKPDNKQINEDNEVSNEEKSSKIQNNTISKLFENFPIIPYYTINYTNNQIVLIVGGETEGFSAESLELMKNREGIRVNIPLNNEIESLNAGIAFSVVAFEIKRQILKATSKLYESVQ